MELKRDDIERLRGLIEEGPKRVVIVSHVNPDGDAIGSSLAWGKVLREQGHDVTCIVPNHYANFLDWMPGISKIEIFDRDHTGTLEKKILEAELIFCMDFNSLSRVEKIGELIARNEKSKVVLIDHHLDPDVEQFDLMFSVPHCSSTSFLVYTIINALYGKDIITKKMAEALYVGIITDTGNFSYSFLTADLFRGVADLVDRGIDVPYVHDQIYSSFTIDRVKLLGHTLNNLEVVETGGFGIAYMSLTDEEQRQFNFQAGDTEGFVNYPLTVRDLSMSAIFIENRHFVRSSFRSTGDVDVSLFSQLYFEGGGHKRASGGRSYRSMEQTLDYFRNSVVEFFSRYPEGYDPEAK